MLRGVKTSKKLRLLLLAGTGLGWITLADLANSFRQDQGYLILGLGDDFSWFQPSNAKFSEV